MRFWFSKDTVRRRNSLKPQLSSRLISFPTNIYSPISPIYPFTTEKFFSLRLLAPQTFAPSLPSNPSPPLKLLPICPTKIPKYKSSISFWTLENSHAPAISCKGEENPPEPFKYTNTAPIKHNSHVV